MQRITVEEVKAAYAATGLRPIRMAYRTTTGGVTTCGCPAVAVAIYRDPAFREHLLGCGVDDHLEKVFGDTYVNGFVNGVDGGLPLPGAKHPDYLAGQEDGATVCAAWPQILEVINS